MPLSFAFSNVNLSSAITEKIILYSLVQVKKMLPEAQVLTTKMKAVNMAKLVGLQFLLKKL